MKLSPVVACAFFLFPIAVQAQNNRSAVSVVGSDLNTCTVASPCRSFGRAILQTNAGGEVIAIDSGGYGPFSVDRAITVQAAPGVYAGVTQTAGDAISVSATASSSVTLRNLVLNGLGTGSSGVAGTGNASEIHVENCVIQNFANYGVISFLNIRVSDTLIRKCGSGIWIDNAGGPVKATVLNVIIKDVAGGDPAAPGTGILSWRNSTVSARNVAVIKAAGIALLGMSNGVLNLETCLATDSGTGVASQDTAVVRISNNFLTTNTTGVDNAATIETFGNNKVRGNALDLAGAALTSISQN